MNRQPQSAVVPMPPSQRIETIDILRGFAIFGILLVNMALFTHSIYGQALNLNEPSGALDRLARWGIQFFAEGKFYRAPPAIAWREYIVYTLHLAPLWAVGAVLGIGGTRLSS